MAQKANSHDNHQKKARQNGLPVSIHPDDAKDKVFTAILKALLKMGNKPSSPKELANIIVKHKYATLGGATPFATVSSRISQHFKRAAEHNPPRAPLLAKHVDQNHSRKINYSLATGDNPAQQPQAAAATTTTGTDNDKDSSEIEHSPTAAATTTKESFIADPNRTNSKTRRHPISITSSNLASKAAAAAAEEDSDEDDDEEDDSEEEFHFHPSKKHKTEHVINTPTSPSIHPIQNEPAPSTIDGYTESPTLLAGSDEESDGGLSDYHEEMLKGDEDLDILAARRLSRRQSKSIQKANVNKDISSSSINNNNSNTNTTHSGATNTTASPSSTTAVPTSVDPLSKDTSSKRSIHPSSTSTNSLAPPPPPTATRKPSFSFSSGFPGDQELWTPFSFEHDFDSVFLHDASTAHHIPFNIATPESVSVSELDNYFSSTTTTSTSTATSRSQRKSFSSAMLGPNDKSLLQKVLLASAARGVADKIDEEDEEEESKKEKKVEEKEEKKDAKDEKEEEEEAKVEKSTTIKSLSSSTLMDVDNGEDFVKFEDDEKKEASPPSKKQPDILPSTSTLTPLPPSPAPAPPPSTTTAHIPKITTPTPTPPPPAATATTSQTPATPTTTTLSAAEILKSMNIQNLNLSALHQMTTSISSLQQISPTFDLAKTMAAYMQSLAKSANANASSSNSPHATDLKSILTRFPALEAFLKKDQVPQQQPPQTPAAPTPAPPPPLVSPSTDFVPNLVSATSTEPVVHTLNPTTPPMYITLIDQIAVCIVVLPKTEHTPEYRIMRRVDTGFINGTVLLTAGGIETESERSMILSFEMERVRMPKKKSELFGTWIPLRRAQELAATCSIQHKLGHFLEDSIESYFPNPLPIQINTRKPLHRDGRLTALALAALRSADSSKSNGFIVPPISRQSSSSGSMGAAQLQELLLTHPHKALKSNGLNKSPPLLGRYNDIEEDKHHPSKQSVSNNSSSGKEESSDVDIVNSSDSSVAASSNEDEEEDLSDNDDSHRDLEGMLNRNKQTLHIRPRDLLKKKRKHTEDLDIVEEPAKVPKSRKKTSNSNSSSGSSSSGGKWSSSSGNSNGKSSTATVTTNAKKPSTIIIKKSSSTASGGKKGAASKKEEVIDNVVVEHKPAGNKISSAAAKVETPPPSATTTVADEEPEEAVDDEDEDIDIGGSDFDDDLR